MKNLFVARSIFSVSAVLALALPASAQVAPVETQPNHGIVSTTNQVYLRNNATVEVTYFDNDPVGSSRRLGRPQQLAMTAGREPEVRRALIAAAPKGAQWARVRVPGSRMFLVNLHPGNSNHLNDKH